MLLPLACDRAEPASAPPSATQAMQACEAVERLIDAGRNDAALDAAEALAKARPDDPMACEMLGRARMAAGAPVGDIADAWARAAAFRPDSPGTQSAAGVTAAAAGRAEASLDFHARAETLEPGNPQHAMQRANALRSLGRHAEAVVCARRACDLAPLDPSARLALAQALLASGDRTGACDAALQASRASPADPSLRLAAAALLRDAGSPQQAVSIALGLAEPADAPPEAIECLARCQSAASLHADAARSWQRLADQPLSPWRPCLEVASCLASAGDRAGAGEWISRARERHAPAAELEAVQARLRAVPPSSR